MPTIMCTRCLWGVIGSGGALPARQRATNEASRLTTWSARDVTTNAGRIVVALEEATYLTVVFPLVPLPDFLRAFTSALASALDALDVAGAHVASEVDAIGRSARFARNDNRSLLGSVNDVAFHADVLLERVPRLDRAILNRVQRELNDMPHVHREPPFPSEAARRIFQAPSVVH